MENIPYCYLFSRELNFTKMERAYFAGLNFRDLAKKYVKNVENTFLRVFYISNNRVHCTYMYKTKIAYSVFSTLRYDCSSSMDH